jgi:hypothetical protein
MMGLGGMHGGGRHGGHRGFGYGIFNTEATQSYFEDTFSDLMTEYDDGLAGIEDYYNSDEYDDVVSDVELLSDRYGFFLNGIERAIDRFDSMLTSLNDQNTYFDDLLAEYQADEELSEERLERIETWITTIQDILGLKIDVITEKKTTLTENYDTYTTFGEEIDSYLDSIITASGGTVDTDETSTETSALAASAPLYANAEVVAACEQASAAATAVPEPQGVALLIGVSLGFMSPRLRRAA